MHPADEPFKVREIWPPGTVIKGDYAIEKRLGGGGFGTVYLARHRFLGTMHVIKRLHEQFACDPDYARKFVNEGRAIRRLKACPNIVEVEHMTQSEDGHLILVMEHISGGDLGGLMDSRALIIAEVIEFGRQIAVALQAAHQSGLIHRDIKPPNVLVSQDSTGKTLLKLIDFGIAADHESNAQTSVMRGGSIGFAAPEQWVKAGKELDGRADLYALGATMYRMLTGQMPYPDVFDIGGWIERVKAGAPVAVGALRVDCPAALSTLVMEMLALKPEGRPANAAVVAARLAEMQTAPVKRQTLRTDQQETLVGLIDDSRSTGTGSVARSDSVIPPKWWKLGFGTGSGTVGPRNLWLGVGGGTVAVLVAAVSLGTWPMERAGSPMPPSVGSPGVVTPKKSPMEAAPAPKKGIAVIPDSKGQREPPRVRPEQAAPAKPQPSDPPPPRQSVPVMSAPPISPVDHVVRGDKARDSGDFVSALQHYKAAGNAMRLAGLQKAVEGETEERASGMMDHGRYSEALTLVDNWSAEFPGSQRLRQLRAKIVKARDSQ